MPAIFCPRKIDASASQFSAPFCHVIIATNFATLSKSALCTIRFKSASDIVNRRFRVNESRHISQTAINLIAGSDCTMSLYQPFFIDNQLFKYIRPVNDDAKYKLSSVSNHAAVAICHGTIVAISKMRALRFFLFFFSC